MKNIILPAFLALLTTACVTQAQPNRLAMSDPAAYRAACGSPGTGDLQSPAFRECLTYFSGFVAGHEAKNAVLEKAGRQDFCVAGSKDTIEQNLDKFRTELRKPGANIPGYVGTATDVHLAMTRAYPCK